MNTLTIIEYLSYIAILLLAMYNAFKIGEKSGSVYMLDYLRSNTYNDPKGKPQPFLNDTGFNRFMAHIRKEKGIDIK
jgi:hypothetical protein